MLISSLYVNKLCLTALTVILLLTASTLTHARDLEIVFSDYKPYSWQDQNGESHGLEVEILREALQVRMGIKTSFKVLPWARAQKRVQNGFADAFVAVPTLKRLAYTKASKQAIATWGVSIFTYSKSPQMKELRNINALGQLKPYRLGSMIGNGWAEENLAGMNVKWVAGMDQLITMLALERIDAVADSPMVIHFYAKKNNVKGVINEVKKISSSHLYLCLSLKSEYVSILPEFDKTIIKMRKDGSLQKILNHYQ